MTCWKTSDTAHRVTTAPDIDVRSSNARGRKAREAILMAATRLFAERGYEGTSIADVASGGGSTKPAVLYHFTDKETLWRTCVETLWAEVEDFYRDNWPRDLPPSRARVEKALTLFVDAGLRWPAYIRIPFIEGAAQSWRSEWLVDRHFGIHVRQTDKMLIACQKLGQIPPGDIAHYHALLTSPINVFLAQPEAWNRALERRLDDRDALVAYVRLACDLTFRSETLDNSE
jgi:AcrR family transcriptional regulator